VPASITWSGGVLQNFWAGTVADRFNNWRPRSFVVGQKRSLLATGERRVWAYRTSHGAEFELRDIPHTSMEAMAALALHLDGGGIVEVDTGDGVHVYPNCCLAPDADPPFPDLADARSQRYTMSFRLINLDGAPMLCIR
jgi:hypothetical protein